MMPISDPCVYEQSGFADIGALQNTLTSPVILKLQRCGATRWFDVGDATPLGRCYDGQMVIYGPA
jgi:hypothetical protein